MSTLAVALPRQQIEAFCRKWTVRELSLLGSEPGDDPGPDDELDLVVTFADHEPRDLWDMLDMRAELRVLFGRDVDLVEERSVWHPARRSETLQSKWVIYPGE